MLRTRVTALVLFATGCAREEAYYSESIKGVLDAHCVKCHFGAEGAAPSLATYEDVLRAKDQIGATIRERSMPPLRLDASCTEYRGSHALAKQDAERIEEWIASGAPEGDAAADPLPPSQPTPRADLTIEIGEGSGEDVHCFLVPWPDVQRSIVAWSARPNPELAWLRLVLITADRVEKYRALDEQDPSPGWSCAGNIVAGSLDSVHDRTEFLGRLGRERSEVRYPEGTSIRVPDGAVLGVQMARKSAEIVTIDFELADSTPRGLITIPWLDQFGWAIRDEFVVEVGETSATTSYTAPFLGYVEERRQELSPPFWIYGLSLEMNELGVEGRVMMHHNSELGVEEDLPLDDPTAECLLRIQRGVRSEFLHEVFLAEPRELSRDDLGYLECAFDTRNSPAAERVKFGPGANDEVCASVLYVAHEN